jgi:hypothetical protein
LDLSLLPPQCKVPGYNYKLVCAFGVQRGLMMFLFLLMKSEIEMMVRVATLFKHTFISF